MNATRVGQSEEEQYKQPKPYSFGYEIVDEEGNQQHRAEVADERGAVKGTYGYLDRNGFARQVNYVADQFGYRASISSNEPGVISHQPAAAVYSASDVQSEDVVPAGQPLAVRLSRSKQV